MKIKTVIGILLIAMYPAVPLSPIHAQTAGEILKAYDACEALSSRAGTVAEKKFSALGRRVGNSSRHS
jgi:hypothetical protein